MLGDAICMLHTQNPRALQAKPSKLRFMNLLLSLVSVYQLLGLGLVSGANGLLGISISFTRVSKNLSLYLLNSVTQNAIGLHIYIINRIIYCMVSPHRISCYI